MTWRGLAAVVTTLAMSAGTATADPVAKNVAPARKAEPAKPLDRPGPGDKRRIVGILEVRVEGVPKEIQRQFQSDLEKQLDSRQYWLAPQQRLHDMMANSTKWTEGCVIGPCLKEVRVQTGADLVLLASITGSDNSFGYVVTLVRTDTGRFVAQETDRCEVCTVKEALANAILAAVRLVTAVPEQLPDEDAQAHATVEQLDLKLANQQAQAKHHNHVVGVALTLTGLVAAGAGMALYFVQDRSDYALATAGVGVGATLGGIVTLAF